MLYPYIVNLYTYVYLQRITCSYRFYFEKYIKLAAYLFLLVGQSVFTLSFETPTRKDPLYLFRFYLLSLNCYVDSRAIQNRQVDDIEVNKKFYFSLNIKLWIYMYAYTYTYTYRAISCRHTLVVFTTIHRIKFRKKTKLDQRYRYNFFFLYPQHTYTHFLRQIATNVKRIK